MEKHSLELGNAPARRDVKREDLGHRIGGARRGGHGGSGWNVHGGALELRPWVEKFDCGDQVVCHAHVNLDQGGQNCCRGGAHSWLFMAATWSMRS